MFKYKNCLNTKMEVPKRGKRLSYHTWYDLQFQSMGYNFIKLSWMLDGACGDLIATRRWTEWKDV